MKPEEMLERMAAASLMVATGEPWGDASEDVRETEFRATQAALRVLVEMHTDKKFGTGVQFRGLAVAVLAITEIEL